MISFEYPLLLALLVLFILCAKYCPMRSEAILFPHLQRLSTIKNSKNSLVQLLKWVAIIGSIIALASPVMVDKFVPKNKIGYDMVLTLDASQSMLEANFDEHNVRKNKFDAVKEIVRDFIDKRENDNIGSVVFGDFAYVASPLTFDKDILKMILGYMEVGIAGIKTAITDSLAQSIKLLQKSTSKSKTIILLTDGMNTAGNIPLNVVLNMAKKHKIKIYTIGIGNERGVDVALLENIAKETQGKFYFAHSASMLKSVYADINAQEKSQIRTQSFLKKEYFFEYPLFVATMALLFYLFLSVRRSL